MKKRYESSGYVLGNHWGGGSGAYSTKHYGASTKKELMEKMNKALSDGSLDSGMGFESLKGALMNVTTISSTTIEGKLFVNKETELVFIGDLSEEEQNFLEEVFINS